MHYFVLRESASVDFKYSEITTGTVKPKVIKTVDLSPLREADYISRGRLVSDRLKLLLEMYLPGQSFTPVIFWNPKEAAQTSFWTFEPPLFEDCEVTYGNNGMPQYISFRNKPVPIAFSVPPQRGVYSSIINLAVAESILRRGILGLNLTKIDLAHIPSLDAVE